VGEKIPEEKRRCKVANSVLGTSEKGIHHGQAHNINREKKRCLVANLRHEEKPDLERIFGFSREKKRSTEITNPRTGGTKNVGMVWAGKSVPPLINSKKDGPILTYGKEGASKGKKNCNKGALKAIKSSKETRNSNGIHGRERGRGGGAT